jgi:hypothetical protein
VWNPPATLPFEGSKNKKFDPARPILLFLDEMMQASPSVQTVAFQLVHERRIGEHTLMPNVYVVGASNRQSDRAGAHRMLTPLANRMTHVELSSNLDSWCNYIWSKNKSPVVTAFIRLRPDLLSTFDPNNQEPCFGSERSWEVVCDILDRKPPPDLRFALVSGTVGEGSAAELEAFIRTWESMPDIDQLLEHPDKGEVPQEPAMLLAISAALAHRVTPENFNAVITYGDRMGNEYLMRTVKDCLRRVPALMGSPEFNKFAVKHAKELLDD